MIEQLTDKLIRAMTVPDGKREIYERESSGLTIRVRASGAKSFYFTFTRPGRKGSFKRFIGKFPKLNVAAARRQAAALASVPKGVDLIEAKRAEKRAAEKARRAARDVVTLGAAIKSYAVWRQRDGIVNWKYEVSYLGNLSEHFNTDIRELTRRDVMNAVEKLSNKLSAAGKRKCGAAAGLYKHAFTFFAWCVDRGYRDDNPLAGARYRQSESRDERLEREAKKHPLDDAEFVKVWAASNNKGVFGLWLRFGLLTGTRRDEPPHLTWADVKVDRVIIPAEFTKMGRDHAIPRTALLNEVLESARQYKHASSDYVFPSTRVGKRIRDVEKLDQIVRDAGVARFTMQDTRRTVRTTMGHLGISTEHQRLCIGQKPNSLDARYDFGDHWAERCAAFERYHAHITKLIGGNVIALPVKVA